MAFAFICNYQQVALLPHPALTKQVRPSVHNLLLELLDGNTHFCRAKKAACYFAWPVFLSGLLNEAKMSRVFCILCIKHGWIQSAYHYLSVKCNRSFVGHDYEIEIAFAMCSCAGKKQDLWYVVDLLTGEKQQTLTSSFAEMFCPSSSLLYLGRTGEKQHQPSSAVHR